MQRSEDILQESVLSFRVLRVGLRSSGLTAGSFPHGALPLGVLTELLSSLPHTCQSLMLERLQIILPMCRFKGDRDWSLMLPLWGGGCTLALGTCC